MFLLLVVALTSCFDAEEASNGERHQKTSSDDGIVIIEGMSTLRYCERRPPLALLIAAQYKDVILEFAPMKQDVEATLTLISGDVLRGRTMLKYLGSIGNGAEIVPLGDPLVAANMDQWLDHGQYVTTEYDLGAICDRLNTYLSLRTVLVGSTITVADLYIWEQLRKSRMELKSYVHVQRWYSYVSKLPQTQAVVEKWCPTPRGTKNSGSNTSNAPSRDSTASYKLELPNAVMGKVVTRFPPEPSGYMHIGHAKAALLNFHTAKMYNGKLIIRFDDTNPMKEKDEFAENILNDLAALQITTDQPITYTSNYFDEMITLATEMIENGSIYADDTPVDVMRQERMDGIESKCRTKSTEDSLKQWLSMQKGKPGSDIYCLRIRLDMQAANKALRDPVVYRSNKSCHWRTGMRFKVYPTYDFACPYVDSTEGVTHAMRSSEYKDREAQYYLILKEIQKVRPSLPDVTIIEFSRLNLIYTVLSKRKLQWFVNTGRVEGWDDPRFPTVQGMMRRGLTLAALKEYILSQGASKNITFQEWDKIWTINKKQIDPVVPRHTAVENEGRVRLRLDGSITEENIIVPKHKKNADAGKKLLVRSSVVWIDGVDAEAVSVGEEMTLMDWGNCVVEKKEKSEMFGRLHLEGDFKKTKWKLTWLADVDELVPLSLVYFDYLITKKRLDEHDNFEECVNPHSMSTVEANGDRNMRTLSKGDIIQLERKGYFIVDRPFWKATLPMILFNIPDGRLKK